MAASGNHPPDLAAEAGCPLSGPSCVVPAAELCPAIDCAMVLCTGGRVRVGTDDRTASYDNERPAHELSLTPSSIDVAPVTNATYHLFVDDGGYDEPAHGSEAGWRWRCETGLRAPKHWERGDNGVWSVRSMDRVETLDPLRPVCQVCYREANAYAIGHAASAP